MGMHQMKKIYAISCDNYIMCFNSKDNSVQKKRMAIENVNESYQYSNITEGSDGNLYSMPCNGTKVLQINTATLTATTVGNDLGNQQWKFSSAIFGKDGILYGIPFCAPHVLRFNPNNNKATIIGEEYVEKFKWIGGCLATDGNIYCSPGKASRILKIRTGRWYDQKHHIMLRCLVEQGRAFAKS